MNTRIPAMALILAAIVVNLACGAGGGPVVATSESGGPGGGFAEGIYDAGYDAEYNGASSAGTTASSGGFSSSSTTSTTGGFTSASSGL
jgi:hypothetical protein